jgi:hypothetical protein
MDVHQRQQFDTLLGDAGEAFVERIVQRCAGQDNALAALSRDRNADGVWLDEFVDAVFADGCLDNAEGAGWVLGALKTRPLDVAALALPAGGERGAGHGRAGSRDPGEVGVRRPAPCQGPRSDEPSERVRMSERSRR